MENGEITPDDKFIQFEDYTLFDKSELFLITKKQLNFTFKKINQKGEHNLKSVKWQINDGEKSEYQSEFIIEEPFLSQNTFNISAYYNALIKSNDRIKSTVNWINPELELPAILYSISTDLEDYFYLLVKKLKNQISDNIEWELLSGENEKFTSIGISSLLKNTEELRDKFLIIDLNTKIKTAQQIYSELLLIDYKRNRIHKLIKKNSGKIEWNKSVISEDEITKLTKDVISKLSSDKGQNRKKAISLITESINKLYGIEIKQNNEDED